MRGKTQEQDVVFCISLWRVDGKEPALGALLPWTVPTLLLQWERAKNNSFVWKQQCERNHKIPPFFFLQHPFTLHFAAFEAPQRRPTRGSGSPETGKKHIRESGENRRESTSTGPTLQPVTFSVMYTAHIWCTMAEQPLPPNHFKQNWPRFGYSCRAAVSCAGWGGTVCISLCERVFFFWQIWMEKVTRSGAKVNGMTWRGPGYGLWDDKTSNTGPIFYLLRTINIICGGNRKEITILDLLATIK